MTLTARKYAWLNRILPKFRHLAGLYSLEILVILSWTLLLNAIFTLISGNRYLLLPLSYLQAVMMLAWLEQTRTMTKIYCLFEAFNLAEISTLGRPPTQWQTLRRLLFTPPLILLMGIGFLPIPGKKLTLLQFLSGTRIIPLDTNMDPRTKNEIQNSKHRALIKAIAYTLTSLIVSTIIIFIPPANVSDAEYGQNSEIPMLPEEERELLAAYLDLKALYPDSIEFHVRLASLYYRNNMEEDLALELYEVRRLDPAHSILLLEEDLSVSIEDLQIHADSIQVDLIETDDTDVLIARQTEDDSMTVESGSSQPDSVRIDLRLVASDSLEDPEDSTLIDSTSFLPDTLSDIETDSLIIPEINDTLLLPPLPDRSRVSEPQDSSDQDEEIGEFPPESEQEDSLLIPPTVEDIQEPAPETEIEEPEETPEEVEPPASTLDPEGT